MQVQADRRAEDDLRHYLHILGRRRWLIIGVTVLVALAALAWSLRKEELYRATAEILLFADDVDDGAAPSDSERALANEIGLFGSQEVRDAVTEQLGSTAPGVSAAASDDADVIVLTAESPDARAAQQAANTYVAVYRQLKRTEQVEALRDDLQQLQSERQAAREVIDALVASRESLVTQINATPPGPERDALTAQLSDLDARTGAANATLSTIQAEQDAEIARLQTAIRESTGGVRVLNLASLPSEPFYPDPIRDLTVGMAIGLVLGLVVAFVREQLDDRVHERADLERFVGGVPVLGAVPRVPGWRNGDEATLVMVGAAESPVAEAYRGLVTAIEFVVTGSGNGVILFTSPNVSEGKTTTVANLGVAFAEAGHSVIVVDADLRRPRLHQFYDLDGTTGLAQVLSGKLDVAEVRRAVKDREGLDAIAAGSIPPNPTELLRSETCAAALGKLAESYDIVLIDCPPVLPVSDALITSRFADAVVLVASAGSTRRRPLNRALDALRGVDAPLKGTVINRVSGTDADAYSYYDSSTAPRSRRRSKA